MMTPWIDVVPGDVVRGGDGHDWTVTARNGSVFILNREGRRAPFAKSMTGSVEVVSRAEDSMRGAVGEIASTLGGEILHRQEDDEPPACPAAYRHPGALMAHLYILHGVRYAGVKDEPTLDELEKMHEDAHAEKNDGYIHHHHRQDVLAINGEEF